MRIILTLVLFFGTQCFLNASRSFYFNQQISNVESEHLDFSLPNTIYNISDHLDLRGKTINVASRCCLNFVGGSISNGTLIGNETGIYAPFGKIFSSDLVLKGTFKSDKIPVSWWVSDELNDNTNEVQSALNAILLFSNRIFDFDKPVRITDVSFSLKWSPGVKFTSSCNSNQGKLAITVFGQESHGLDISATENLVFDNLIFFGDEDNPPKTLLFASRFVQNKQCPGHKFVDVTFCGKVTKALVYNYSGESWYMDNCTFKLSNSSVCSSMYYATTINSLGLLSKFGNTESDINPLTHSNFVRCIFYNATSCASIHFEGARNSFGKIKNVASICFDKCYFYTPKSTSIRFSNVLGSIAILNSIDESGADSKAMGSKPFYKIDGTMPIQVVTFLNNSIYSRKNSNILEASVPVINYNAQANYIVNANGRWKFDQLYDSRHYGLSDIEIFEVTGNNKNVFIEGGNIKNIIIKSSYGNGNK